MSYNGRAVLAEVATAAGWRTINFSNGVYAPGLPQTPGVEYVGYQPADGGVVEVVVGWTAYNTAFYVFVAGRGQIKGATALIQARRFIEDNSVVTA